MADMRDLAEAGVWRACAASVSLGGCAASIRPTTLLSLPSKPGKNSPQEISMPAVPWPHGLAFAVPGPGGGRRRHVLDQLEHVFEAARCRRRRRRRTSVLAEDRAALRPQPGGPVAVQRVVAGLELAGGAVDAVAALGRVDRLHRRHVLVHGRRDLDAVLVEQVLAVHQDEDRDVERACRSSCPSYIEMPSTSGLEKSSQSKSGHREVRLVDLVLL